MSDPRPTFDPTERAGVMYRFSLWENTVSGEIDEISGILSNSLSDEPSFLIQQICEAEKHYARMGYLLSECQGFMESGAMEFLPDSSLKEMDRKTLLQAKLSPIRVLKDHLKVLCDAIETRISLGQSILRAQIAFQDVRVMAKSKLERS